MSTCVYYVRVDACSREARLRGELEAGVWTDHAFLLRHSHCRLCKQMWTALGLLSTHIKNKGSPPVPVTV